MSIKYEHHNKDQTESEETKCVSSSEDTAIQVLKVSQTPIFTTDDYAKDSGLGEV